MSLESSTPVQDASVAKEFQLKYEDLLARDIPGRLIQEFLQEADEAADESVLAASVKTHIEFEMQSCRDNPTAIKKRAILNAGIAAKAVLDLDGFLRDDTSKHEPVIYAEQAREHPDEFNHFLRVHFTVANGSHLTVRTRDGRDNPWYSVMPEVRYGVQSPVIGYGKVLDARLQGTRMYKSDDTEQAPSFMTSINMSYPDISRGALWRDAYRLPALTHGTENALDLFTEMIDQDYTRGYTEHRSRRGGYLLMRQAKFMGHAIAESLFTIADESGIIPAWQRQVADELALEAIVALEELHKNGITLDPYKQSYACFLSEGNALELETLDVQASTIATRAKEHAARRRVQASDSEIHQVIQLLTSA